MFPFNAVEIESSVVPETVVAVGNGAIGRKPGFLIVWLSVSPITGLPALSGAGSMARLGFIVIFPASVTWLTLVVFDFLTWFLVARAEGKME